MSNNSEKILALLESSNDTDDEIELLDIGIELANNLKLICLTPLLVALTTFFCASNFLTARYTASVSMVHSNQGNNSPWNANSIAGMVNFLGVTTSSMTSQKVYAYLHSGVLAKTLEKKITVEGRKYFDINKFVASFEKDLVLDENKKSGVLHLRYTNEDAHVAAFVVNSVAEALNQVFDDLAQEDAKKRREQLEKLITDANKKTYQSVFIRESLIQGLLREFESSRLAEQQTNVTLRIIDLATNPGKKVYPQPILYSVVAALVTLGTLISFFIFRTVLRTASRKPSYDQKLEQFREAFRVSFRKRTR